LGEVTEDILDFRFWITVLNSLSLRERARVRAKLIHITPHLNPLPPREGEEVILRERARVRV